MTTMPAPVLTGLPDGFGLYPLRCLREFVYDGVTVELLSNAGRPSPFTQDNVLWGSLSAALVAARVTAPEPPQPIRESLGLLSPAQILAEFQRSKAGGWTLEVETRWGGERRSPTSVSVKNDGSLVFQTARHNYLLQIDADERRSAWKVTQP